jgi:phosphoglucomutase
MLNALAQFYGVTIYDNMLIGFKYIGELILKKENTDEKFVIGGEESLGLLKGDYARDKDAATGALPMMEYAAELKAEGKTLYDKLMELYVRHGIFVEKLENLSYPGAEGFAQMQRIMASLRESAPDKIANQSVTAVIDYQTLTRIDLKTGEKSALDCINGDVFVLEFGDKSNRISIRPSGTEPKVKLYVQWRQIADELSDVESQYDQLGQKLDGLVNELRDYLASL